jgi:tRNA (cmo5U34)-methyltransferase
MSTFEKMGDFFDKRSDLYDDHMKESIEFFEQLYTQISTFILPTQAKIKILDLGCGTGLELQHIFKLAPNAEITGIDLSSKMLDILKVKYKSRLKQINLIIGSYLIAPLGKGKYEYVVSVETFHHLIPDNKLALYRKIKDALKKAGTYIEGDYVVTIEEEKQLMKQFNEIRKFDKSIADGTHHIDIPLSVETQMGLLRKAGFTKVNVVWAQGNSAVFVAKT